jgi:hypothetical protein
VAISRSYLLADENGLNSYVVDVLHQFSVSVTPFLTEIGWLAEALLDTESVRSTRYTAEAF